MDLICLVPYGTVWVEYPFAKRAPGDSRYTLFGILGWELLPSP